ncbi:MAG: G5 domain-containing protein [Clostridia bacterium]
MRAKDKASKKVKFTIKNLILFLGLILIILYSIIFYNYFFTNNEVLAKETSAETTAAPDVIISTAEKVNLDNIIENNTKNMQKEEYIKEETTLEYITKYQQNTNLAKGKIQVVQEGREGIQEITKKRIYENGELKEEKQVSSKVTKAAVNKIVEIGAGSKTSNYKIQKGDIVYITSDRANIMLEPDENSEKITTLSKQTNLKVLEVKNDWYKINTQGTTGYVKIENTGYDEKEEPQENKTTNSVAKLDFNMALNKPSGLTLEQFKKILKDSKDTNKIFEKNAEYFYYIEKQYNINGIFVASVGIHESAWGTSKIALAKHNLFGYGAYDSNPYNGAYQFTDYSEAIDLIARVFVKYYINPKGTSIYGGEKAAGTYYVSPTLSGVNTKYATDKNWANGVYSHMKYLYNKL